MDISTISPANAPHYELRFTQLSNAGRGYAFPCDAVGVVDIDQLSERGRDHYFYARAVVGSELSMPRVVETVA